MSVAPDGKVYALVRIDNDTGFGTGYLHHLVRYDPAEPANRGPGHPGGQEPRLLRLRQARPRRQAAAVDARLPQAARRHAHAAARPHGPDGGPRRHDLRHRDLPVHPAADRRV